MSPVGTSRHFTAMQHSGRFRGEADMHRRQDLLYRSKMTLKRHWRFARFPRSNASR
jgi:hypothetical protein